MKATMNDRFTITLDGCIAAAALRERIEPTAAGRAYAACVRAEADTIDACADVQEGAPLSVVDAFCHRQAVALADFREATGTDFYHCGESEPEPVRPLPNPRFCPSTCGKCGIGNIYGPPSCLDKDCPNPCK